MPTRIGSSWGGVIFTVALFILTELALWVWGNMKNRWERNALIGVGVVGAAWVMLLSISIIATVYDDHVNLVADNIKLTKEYKAKLATAEFKGDLGPILTAPIGSRNQDTLVTSFVVITNSTGPPSALYKFTMELVFTNGKKLSGWAVVRPTHDIRLEDMGHQIVILDQGLYLPAVTAKAISVGDLASGWIQSVFRNTQRQDLEADPPMLELTFYDVITDTLHSIRKRLRQDVEPLGIDAARKR